MTLRCGQTHLLSFKGRSDVFLLLERDTGAEPDEPFWLAVRLSDGRVASVSEDWLLSDDGELIA